MNSKIVRNSRHMKDFNRHSVLRLIRRRATSRSELAAETGLTRAAISLITEGLVREGLLKETGRRESQAGRKPVLLEVRPEYAYAAGLTISRTGAALGLLNLAGELVQRSTLSIEGLSRKMALRQMKRGVSRLLDSSRQAGRRILGLGISAPGPIEVRTGTILNPPNFSPWHDVCLVEEFRELMGDHIHLENNSTALTLAEKAYGKGTMLESFLLLVVESGIGAGIVRNQELYRGWDGFGSEVGHTSIDLQGPRCSCGLSGCLELYASVPALLTQARKERPRIRKWNQLVDLALEGDEVGQRLISDQAQAIGTALVSLLNVLELDAVILTGDILYRGELLRNAIEQFINQRAINRRLRHVPVFLSPLGPDCELIAAAAIIIEKYFLGEIPAPR